MKSRLVSVALAFIKLGFIAFGGPAAAYAMMRQEFVIRQGWISEDDFFDFMGIANLVPGPNATELAILIGYHHAGWWGLILGGACYIFPAMVAVLALAWTYTQFGALPAIEGILYGIKPVVLAILISAMWGILKPRLKNIVGLGLAVVVCVAFLFGVSPIILLLGGGILMALLRAFQNSKNHLSLSVIWLPLPGIILRVLTETIPFNLWRLFWVFLKAGALMLGSGYVLLAFIHDDLVVRLGWLTEWQMVDAIAVGQVTPGPLATTATFVGYIMGGLPAALLATLAMFLPSFMIVILMLPVIEKIRASQRYQGFLEGVNFAALGLMAGVTWEITETALVDPITGLITVTALILLILVKLDTPWLVLGGALIGLIRSIL